MRSCKLASIFALMVGGGCAKSGQRSPLPLYTSIVFDATAYGPDGKAHGWNAAIRVSAWDAIEAEVIDVMPLHLPSYTADELKQLVLTLHEWNRERVEQSGREEYLHRIQYSLWGNGLQISDLALYRHTRELPESVRDLLSEALNRAVLQSIIPRNRK